MANWDVTTAGAAFEFETTLMAYPTRPFAIDTNHFFVCYQGSGSDGFASVFTVNTSTWAVTEQTTLEHDTQNQLWSSAVRIDINHFALFYLGSTTTTDAYVQTFTVNTTNYAISTASSRFLFDTDVGSYNSAVMIDANHIINFWAGSGADGYAQVFTVNTTTWAVTTAGASLEFDTVIGQYHSAHKIDDTHFLNFYAGNGSDGYVDVFVVNTTTWAVSTVNTRLEYDTVLSAWMSSYKIDTNHFINFWSDTSNDGKCQVFTVNTTSWAVTTANALLEFDTQQYLTNSKYSIAQIDANHFLHTWAGPDTGASTAYDGFAQVFEVNTTTWAVTTAGAPFEFDATQGEWNALSELIAGTTNKFLHVWAGSGDDGYAEVLNVEIPNVPPTVVLNSPADAGSTSDTTPVLDFTGTDSEGDSIRYEVQVDTVNTFDSTTNNAIDSYPISNAGITWAGLPGDTQRAGQSFSVSSTVKLTTAKFALVRAYGSEGGTCVAKLYAHSGTYGTDGVPTGSALATSDTVSLSSVPSLGGGWEGALTTWLSTADESSTTSFTFSTPYELQAGTKYFVTVEYTVDNYLLVVMDGSSPTASGNYAYWNGSSWVSGTADEIIFYLYGTKPLLDKVSGTDTGFANPDNGGDTDQFNSGENIQYTVQAGDALTAGTYYWRVRGIDPSGTNTYGAWSSTRSFTITAGGTEVSAVRPAETHGIASANASRDAETAGQNTANSTRGAETAGVASAYSGRGAETHGQASTSDTRGAELTGGNTATAERDAETAGIDSSSAERDAELAGQNTANASRGAETAGIQSTSDTRDVETHGVATGNAERSAEVEGVQGAQESRPAEVAGVDTANATRASETHGQNTHAGARVAELAGEVTTSATRATEVHGQSTAYGVRSVEVTGALDVTAERGAEVYGVNGDNAQRSAEIHGIDSIFSERSGEVHGQNTASGVRSAQVHGSQNVQNARSSEVHGQNEAQRERSAETAGQATQQATRLAETTGTLSSVASRSVETHGKQSTSSTRSAEITGSLVRTAERSAEISGAISTGSSRSAEVTGALIDPYCKNVSPYSARVSPYTNKEPVYTGRDGIYEAKSSPYLAIPKRECT
jgi:hypothetical protein